MFPKNKHIFGERRYIKIQLMIIFFLDNHDKNCHLNFRNDKNQVTFLYVVASGPLDLALFFCSLNWTKTAQVFHCINVFTTFLLLDEQFLVLEQLRLTDFVKVYLNDQPTLILFYQGNSEQKLKSCHDSLNTL